ncbi:hypothetical protein DIY07_02730 [Streptococcus iniae]|uniref:CopG family transcriptional regulator n=1 Tax=Streptococcus iniae TaxID=1346 RepID=A0A3L8GF89_STRIN|nr:hypothetical protein [Streptococcus iniae]MCA1357318.1 hypothetical protein [Streptococcus iniae]RLU55665.1 hypothetical protein DIY09_02635 [Streptococcus iniae]RLU58063.1 hypothetical protein DIY07_02730 [Streptococcus iniae]
MAFEPKKDKISKALSETITEAPKTQNNPRRKKAGRPAGKTKFPFQFTLKPQNREKLDEIAESQGFTTASAFLDDWIEKYK